MLQLLINSVPFSAFFLLCIFCFFCLSKYVTWDEIEALWDRGCSLLIYQHLRRETRVPMAHQLAAQLRMRTGAPVVEAFRTAHVLFLLAARDRLARRIESVTTAVSQRWRGQIDPMGLSGGSTS